MCKKDKARKVLDMSVLAGEIMLENGAETYRVEDTIIRICNAIDIIDYVDVFVIPTGIFLTIGYDNEIMTYIQRTKTKRIDLNKITLVNEFSREFVSSKMTVSEGVERLVSIRNLKPYSDFTKSVLGGGLIGGFSALLFKGSFSDFLAAFLVSVLVVKSREVVGRKVNIISYVKDFMGSLVSGALAILFVKIGIGNSIDNIIIGSIMPLVPGFAITNATRDSISGDFLAGVSRGLEAILCALSIALGVGIILYFY
ncbi:hypothetical protein CLPU_5c00160 [Gottschalkia purinilytica]|uniref:Threonine/serine exporter-like N-terminal domain-containing protein n=1 Tax=Gottschalkia purinilytica TaxID=1503 RepID=A0A0L0WB09_GOTPU|nr:threonine/serine exporter family protein [Gottschalkia purinilytica]KNF08709.1 hypothetical protein CLPU_5c00160 [Gottschalkia purinilytica]